MKKWASFYSALSDSIRLEVLSYLMKNGEQCVCDLMAHFNTSQSKLSYHLKLLHEASLVNVNKKGKWNYYYVNEDVIKSKLHAEFIYQLVREEKM